MSPRTRSGGTMKKLEHVAIATALVSCLLLAPSTLAKKKGASTEPGKYKEWKGEIDELEIVRSFRLGDYRHVAVQGFDTDNTPLPDKDDNTFGPVKTVLRNIEGPLAK